MTDADDAAKPVEPSEFRAFLAEIGESQSGFARTLKRIGDTREKATILRSVQRMITGEHKISGEMRVIMAIFRNSRRKRLAQAAELALQEEPDP